jgi:hypothetical protein
VALVVVSVCICHVSYCVPSSKCYFYLRVLEQFYDFSCFFSVVCESSISFSSGIEINCKMTNLHHNYGVMN